MFTLRTAKVVDATQKIAELWRDMLACPQDRPLQQQRIAGLQKEWEAGRFYAPTWAAVECQGEDCQYRINGKHTATLLAQVLNEKATHPVTILQFAADTLMDVAQLYATFDSRMSARTCKDIYRVFAVSNQDFAHVRKTTIGLCATGIALSRWPNSVNASTAAERGMLLLEEPRFVLFVDELLQLDGAAIASRGPVIAAMHRTWQRSQSASREWWTAVILASDPDRAAPSRRLHEQLMSSSVALGTGARPGKKRMWRDEMMIMCLLYWNSYRSGTELRVLKIKNREIPKAQ